MGNIDTVTLQAEVIASSKKNPIKQAVKTGSGFLAAIAAIGGIYGVGILTSIIQAAAWLIPGVIGIAKIFHGDIFGGLLMLFVISPIVGIIAGWAAPIIAILALIAFIIMGSAALFGISLNFLTIWSSLWGIVGTIFWSFVIVGIVKWLWGLVAKNA